MANKEIRDYAKEHGIFLWQIATALEKSESSLTRMLRVELPLAEKQRILHIIDVLSGSN
ncbi:hypothetical protein [Ruminococcus flavefaciens]|uniref:hypothetical protein n=1 Tax=Ruminococcus flavefaciens TaxID=1265 RepID=UPI0018AD3278|nr:hypothetical protein [Ruminococcus flavefaciens]